MNMTHVDTYWNALIDMDESGIAPHLADDIVLLGPIFPEPTEGKAAVVDVLSGFIDVIDSLAVKLKFASGQDVAVFFTFTSNGIRVEGNEHLHLNDDGLVDRIEVAWRPLPSAVLVQEIFANKAGFQPMRLVPA